MPPLPKAKCQVCTRVVAVRNGGELREHQDNEKKKCTGSALQVLPENRES